MKIHRSAPNLAVICMDSRTEGGRIYHKYEKVPIPFHQYSDLILELERMFDVIGYPQAAVQIRGFDGKRGGPSGYSARQPDTAWSTDEMLSMRGEIATIAVHVRLRQHATWQGELYWIEGNKNASFRSELEFLKLIETV